MAFLVDFFNSLNKNYMIIIIEFDLILQIDIQQPEVSWGRTMSFVSFFFFEVQQKHQVFLSNYCKTFCDDRKIVQMYKYQRQKLEFKNWTSLLTVFPTKNNNASPSIIIEKTTFNEPVFSLKKYNHHYIILYV